MAAGFTFTVYPPRYRHVGDLRTAEYRRLSLTRPNGETQSGALDYPSWAVKQMLRTLHPEYPNHASVPAGLVQKMANEFVWRRWKASPADDRPHSWRVTPEEFEEWYTLQLLLAAG